MVYTFKKKINISMITFAFLSFHERIVETLRRAQPATTGLSLPSGPERYPLSVFLGEYPTCKSRHEPDDKKPGYPGLMLRRIPNFIFGFVS